MQHQGGKKPGRKPGSGNKKKSAVILTREYDSGKHAARGPAGGDAPSLGGVDKDGEPGRSERGDDTCSGRRSLLPSATAGD